MSSTNSNSDTGFLSRVKSTAQSLTSTRRPWRDFLDLSSFNLPISLSDATTRISQNLTHFRVNYTIILLSILFLSLIYHPVSLIVFLLTLVAWFFFYFGREEPLTVFGFVVDDRAVAAALFVVTVIALVLTHVWANVLVSVGVGVGLVILHAGLRSTDDLVMDDQESPYAVLLDDVDGGVYEGF
ncbi:hypothetical protein LWI28_001663 [Acer negundo]|uniref:PRA1 family protein n=1 Tax=Acer negundo TaxID=4023 RepID=A0AAD5JIJ1_ACENE|nr:hypothetical protein LWI28_001663 [Acer negundo]KAK4856943.1 hypothetical protein QYF36_022940 [Acer negundo]